MRLAGEALTVGDLGNVQPATVRLAQQTERSLQAFLQNKTMGLDQRPGSYLGISALPNDCGVALRIMTLDAVSLRNSLHKAWACMREHLTGVAPRIRRK